MRLPTAAIGWVRFRREWFGVLAFVATIATLLAFPSMLSTAHPVEIAELVLLYSALALSLNLVFGYLGYLPFSHMTFFGIGAYAIVLGRVKFDAPIWIGLVSGIVISSGMGWTIGRLTLHLRGFYFAIMTVAIAALFIQFLQNVSDLTGGTNGLGIPGDVTAPIPGGELNLSIGATAYYLTVVVVGFIVGGLALLMRGNAGLLARAVRDNELMARSLGIHARRVKVSLFVLSCALASIVGSLYAVYFAYISPASLPLQVSLLIVLMILLGGKEYFWAPLIGVVLLTVGPAELNIQANTEWMLIGALMTASVILLPSGIGRFIAVAASRLRGATEPDRSPFTSLHLREVISAPRVKSHDGSGKARPILELQGVSKHFGGVAALDGVSLRVDRPGEVLGIIGPNGSGKTTLFNVISGVLRASGGSVHLLGQNVTGWSPEAIAGNALVRTFQTGQAFATMTPAEAFRVARLAPMTGSVAGLLAMWMSAAPTPPSEWLGSRPMAALSHGELRIVEIGLALASNPTVLLLDEPAAGLGAEGKGWVLDVIEHAKRKGVAIILIEHDMDMIMSVSDRVIVLDAGRVIAVGTSAEVASNPRVVAAYLGAAAVAPSVQAVEVL